MKPARIHLPLCRHYSDLFYLLVRSTTNTSSEKSSGLLAADMLSLANTVEIPEEYVLIMNHLYVIIMSIEYDMVIFLLRDYAALLSGVDPKVPRRDYPFLWFLLLDAVHTEVL